MAARKVVPKIRKPRAKSSRAHLKMSVAAENPVAHQGVPFPVVAVGASAGGLTAFTALLKALPSKSGMAFVLIQHLDPTHESALTDLLSKATAMPVVEVSNGIAVEPNHVYIIPPNKILRIRKGTLRLTPRSEISELRHPIDDFSIALAEEQGNAAIGVVLSGTGSDGTVGLKAIKAAGGVTFAQDPKTAQWPAMPMNAITAGSVDFVLSPRRLAAELSRIGRHPYLAEARDVPQGSELDRICLNLRSSAGVDFLLYKQATVRRRVARRMALQKITSLTKYAQILKQNPEEAKALADDIFIHVTSFFRDPECFQALRAKVLGKLCGKRAAGDPLRIWVPGCSTGEEVYSIAMLLLEELGERAGRIRIQIFGTDIQERAVERARAGVYTEAAVAGVSPARLKRFFVQTDDGWQIQKFVRDLCVFARHDLASDPSFSRLDLISCRNVLIYMGPALQKRVLSIFQYALKPGGFLFLGNSESVNDHSDFFTAEDRVHRIFLRKLTATAFQGFSPMAEPFREPNAAAPRISAPGASIDFRKEAEAILLQHYMPPALIVDPALHIVHFQGDISPYLAPATGQPSFHLLKMVRPELVVDLRTAIYKARREGIAVHKDDVRFDHQGQPAAVRLEVRPLRKRDGKKQDLLIVFQAVEPASSDDGQITGGVAAGKKRAPEKTARLERELTSAREHLRALIEEHEIAQEEMKAANEEILASNQELQSTNEELETAREELQSSNEELNTVNEELQHRNAELNLLTNDLSNLLVGVDIPVLVLDAGLRVRRFTPVAGTLLNLIPGDIGRPFTNIASNLNVSDWKELFSKVTDQGQLIEREVGDRNGHRYSMRVRPYKTSDNRIEGVLVVLLDTDLIYRARDEASDYARAIVETIHEALVAVDAEFRVLTVNQSFCDLFRVSPQDIQRQSFFGSGAGQISVPRLRELLQDILSKGTEIKDFELDQQFPEIGRRRLVVNAHQIYKTQTILIAIEDITERKRLEQAARAHAQEVQALAASLLTAQEEERRRVSLELHDQIGQQLASLAIDIGGLAADAPHPEDAQSRLRALQARVVKASEVARHIAYELHPSVLDDLGLAASLRSLCKEFSDRAKNVAVEFKDVALPASMPREVASCVYRVAQEGLQNISKHANAKHVSMTIGLQKGAVVMTIADDGAGFDHAAVKGRGGLGLIGMEERARLVKGKLSIAARPGKGTRITIEVPLPADRL
jgi:two-component system CheB/CheR fusion protein